MLERDSHLSAGDWDPPQAQGMVVARGWCGASFGGRLIRFHDAATGPVATENVRTAFGEIVDRIGWVAFDWLGRQFGFALADGQVAAPLVAADLGAGQLMTMGTAPDFLDGVASGSLADALNQGAFAAFRAHDGFDALQFTECVGYKHPPFLGGAPTLENLERSDMDVYWTVIGQVLAQVGRAAPEPAPKAKRRWFGR